jgi:hypothetical protein
MRRDLHAAIVNSSIENVADLAKEVRNVEKNLKRGPQNVDGTMNQLQRFFRQNNLNPNRIDEVEELSSDEPNDGSADLECFGRLQDLDEQTINEIASAQESGNSRPNNGCYNNQNRRNQNGDRNKSRNQQSSGNNQNSQQNGGNNNRQTNRSQTNQNTTRNAQTNSNQNRNGQKTKYCSFCRDNTHWGSECAWNPRTLFENYRKLLEEKRQAEPHAQDADQTENSSSREHMANVDEVFRQNPGNNASQ